MAEKFPQYDTASPMKIKFYGMEQYGDEPTPQTAVDMPFKQVNLGGNLKLEQQGDFATAATQIVAAKTYDKLHCAETFKNKPKVKK